MDVQVPSPQTTLFILLGASAWPFSPEFQGSEAFAKAAQRLKAYFLNLRPFGLPSENLLDLFNSEQSADELDVTIGQFLEQRMTALRDTGNPARDLVLYFIGHGGFVGRDSDFYLAIRRTRMDNPRSSALQMMSLADTLTERARYLRRILILDCCFAAAAFSAFQSGPAQVALEKTVDAFEVRQKAMGFPTKGTTLLCSSNHKSPSLLMPDGSSTMFTKAFLDALIQGTPSQQDRFTLRDVKDRATDLLSEIRNAPKPVVHSPDQSEGDVADIPFFPNPKIEEERWRRTEEERIRLAEEEGRRIEEQRVRRAEKQARKFAEEEQVRKEEEVRVHRAVEEERARQAEEERRRQAEEVVQFRDTQKSARTTEKQKSLPIPERQPKSISAISEFADSESDVLQPRKPVQLPRGRGRSYTLTLLIGAVASFLSGIVESIVLPATGYASQYNHRIVDWPEIFVLAVICLIAGYINGKLTVARAMGFLSGCVVVLTWYTYATIFYMTGDFAQSWRAVESDPFYSQFTDFNGFPPYFSLFYAFGPFQDFLLHVLIAVVIGGLLSLLTAWLTTLKQPNHTQSKKLDDTKAVTRK